MSVCPPHNPAFVGTRPSSPTRGECSGHWGPARAKRRAQESPLLGLRGHARGRADSEAASCVDALPSDPTHTHHAATMPTPLSPSIRSPPSPSFVQQEKAPAPHAPAPVQTPPFPHPTQECCRRCFVGHAPPRRCFSWSWSFAPLPCRPLSRRLCRRLLLRLRGPPAPLS